MARKLYVTDGLLVNGFAYERGDEVTIENETTRKQLLDEGRISTTKPSPEPLPGTTSDAAVPTVTLADFSDEDLLSELESRGLNTASIEATVTNYSEQDKADLEKLVAEREIQVEGTGSKGAVTKDDLVRTLEAADASTDS
ncbi:MAG TPA: hypothetical protein VGC63_04970 [Solirubrobacterales bacterium]|jgi:hypothetical protein